MSSEQTDFQIQRDSYFKDLNYQIHQAISNSELEPVGCLIECKCQSSKDSLGQMKYEDGHICLSCSGAPGLDSGSLQVGYGEIETNFNLRAGRSSDKKIADVFSNFEAGSATAWIIDGILNVRNGQIYQSDQISCHVQDGSVIIENGTARKEIKIDNALKNGLVFIQDGKLVVSEALKLQFDNNSISIKSHSRSKYFFSGLVLLTLCLLYQFVLKSVIEDNSLSSTFSQLWKKYNYFTFFMSAVIGILTVLMSFYKFVLRRKIKAKAIYFVNLDPHQPGDFLPHVLCLSYVKDQYEGKSMDYFKRLLRNYVKQIYDSDSAQDLEFYSVDKLKLKVVRPNSMFNYCLEESKNVIYFIKKDV